MNPPGFAGALNLVDRDSGDVMMIILWETGTQARRALSEYGVWEVNARA